ncbi:CinA family protein [Leuconostoc sp. MS02]|uniref:CinA family protein n=1 Tax=Leuconostoc aquikimchii TaxID=3236804 RepID=A0ABV3S526_9LACO
MTDRKRAVIEYLRVNELTISAAESLTGGLFQSTIVQYPGASKVFEGGLVLYSKWSKIKLVGVSSDLINKYGVVSSEVAAEMATGCMRVMQSDIGIGFTGAAGPRAVNGNSVGTAWIGINIKGKMKTYLVNDASLGRNDFRQYCVDVAFKELAKLLKIED